MPTYADAVIQCPTCSVSMTRAEVVEQENGPRIELYKCADTECGRRAALVYEPGAITDEQKDWIKSEIGRMGAFFPSDHVGPRRR